jgi:hypothetical protein
MTRPPGLRVRHSGNLANGRRQILQEEIALERPDVAHANRFPAAASRFVTIT